MKNGSLCPQSPQRRDAAAGEGHREGEWRFMQREAALTCNSTIAIHSPSLIYFRTALRLQLCGVIHVMTAQRAASKDNNDDDFHD